MLADSFIAAVCAAIFQPYLPGGANLDAHLVHDYLGAPDSPFQTAVDSSIESAVFPKFTVVPTDRPTDRQNEQ